MTIKEELFARSEGKCELCSSQKSLDVYDVPSSSDGSADQSILICEVCKNFDVANENYFRCLSETMWTPIPLVQVMVWRQLNRLSDQAWARGLLEILYLEDDVLSWAKSEEPI